MGETGKKDIQADRGNPSIAVSFQGQKLFMGAFICFALLAIIYVVVAESKKASNEAIVTHEDIAFKTSGQSSAPYIKPDALEKPAQIDTSISHDPAALRHEQMMQAEALRMAQKHQKQLQKRIQSPQIVFDQSFSDPAIAKANIVPLASSGSFLTGGRDAGDTNLTFAAQASGQGFDTSHASRMKNLNTLITQGTTISGILETAIQSDLPGMTRAVVSEDIYSFDGSMLLIPKGSKLVGQYRSGLVRGQSRVFIIWNRLLRNDGVTINLGSFGTDSLGRSVLDGKVDTHFFERFGSSVLLSMIDTGLKIIANDSKNNTSSTVAVETGNNFNRAAEIALENTVALSPTINVKQGKRINVFVGKDLDFSQVSGKTTNAKSL